MAKKHLIHEYTMPIFDNSISYWSMHFISVLECLAYHKNLEYKPISNMEYNISSLALMKGHYPNSFFDTMANYIQNWGIQYFMVHFLNHRMGLGIVNDIKKLLDGLLNIPDYKNYNDYIFYISGHDSGLSGEIRENIDEIYPKILNFNFLDKENLIRNSDICLVLKNTNQNKNIAIFGEIEGNHGDKLFQDGFWDNKPSSCMLGIGAVDGHQKGRFYMEQYLHLGQFPKVNIIFEKSNYVVCDFYRVINTFQNIFNYGLKYKSYNRDNFSYIVHDVIIKYWNAPIRNVIDNLKVLKNSSDDLIGKIDNSSLEFITPIDK